LYQGTTFSRAEQSGGKVRALAPAKTVPSGLKPKSLLTRCGTAKEAAEKVGKADPSRAEARS
jgi:hypothetical protein